MELGKSLLGGFLIQTKENETPGRISISVGSNGVKGGGSINLTSKADPEYKAIDFDGAGDELCGIGGRSHNNGR